MPLALVLLKHARLRSHDAICRSAAFAILSANAQATFQVLPGSTLQV